MMWWVPLAEQNRLTYSGHLISLLILWRSSYCMCFTILYAVLFFCFYFQHSIICCLHCVCGLSPVFCLLVLAMPLDFDFFVNCPSVVILQYCFFPLFAKCMLQQKTWQCLNKVTEVLNCSNISNLFKTHSQQKMYHQHKIFKIFKIWI